jgi:hypothetical protein
VEIGALRNDAACKRSNPERKKGPKKMKFSFLQKHTSRREILRHSTSLAGSALLAHLFPANSYSASSSDALNRTLGLPGGAK